MSHFFSWLGAFLLAACAEVEETQAAPPGSAEPPPGATIVPPCGLQATVRLLNPKGDTRVAPGAAPPSATSLGYDHGRNPGSRPPTSTFAGEPGTLACVNGTADSRDGAILFGLKLYAARSKRILDMQG